jgi:hypothetical protein
MVGIISPTTLLMSPACKSWNLIVIGGLEQTFLANTIFLSITKAKTCWKTISMRYLKIWIQKENDKWPFDHLSSKRRPHTLMKWSISCLNVLCTCMDIKIKWCPSCPLYLWFLTMALSFAIAIASQLMTHIVVMFRVGLVTTISSMKT